MPAAYARHFILNKQEPPAGRQAVPVCSFNQSDLKGFKDGQKKIVIDGKSSSSKTRAVFPLTST